MSWNMIPVSHLGRCLEHVLAPYGHGLWSGGFQAMSQPQLGKQQLVLTVSMLWTPWALGTSLYCCPSPMAFPSSLRVLCVSGALARLRRAFCLPLHISIHPSHPHTTVSSSLTKDVPAGQSSSSPHLTTPISFTSPSHTLVDNQILSLNNLNKLSLW